MAAVATVAAAAAAVASNAQLFRQGCGNGSSGGVRTYIAGASRLGAGGRHPTAALARPPAAGLLHSQPLLAPQHAPLLGHHGQQYHGGLGTRLPGYNGGGYARDVLMLERVPFDSMESELDDGNLIWLGDRPTSAAAASAGAGGAPGTPASQLLHGGSSAGVLPHVASMGLLSAPLGVHPCPPPQHAGSTLLPISAVQPAQAPAVPTPLLPLAPLHLPPLLHPPSFPGAASGVPMGLPGGARAGGGTCASMHASAGTPSLLLPLALLGSSPAEAGGALPLQLPQLADSDDDWCRHLVGPEPHA